MGDFGNKFRKAREKKGVSLDDASNVTKIGARMLQAIEEEQFDQLPGGVFNKGFIRAYAKYLGINDQEAVTEYLDCLRQEQVRAQAVWEPQSRPAPPQKRPVTAADVRPMKPPAPAPTPAVQTDELPDLQLPRAEHVRPPRQKYLDQHRQSGIPWRLVVATLIVFLLATVLWRRHAIGNAAARPMSPTPASVASQPASGSGSVSGGSPNPVSSNSGSPSGNGTAVSNSSNQPSVPATSNTTGSRQSATPAKPVPDNSSGDEEVITRSFVNTPAKPSDKPAAPFMLVIRANENSWISVSADGKAVSQETLIAPAHASIRASREIVAKIGNAAGVSFLWNGQEIPADGAESETKTFVFDAQGMRVIPAAQPANQNQ